MGLQFQRIAVHKDELMISHGCRSRKLRAHFLNHKKKQRGYAGNAMRLSNLKAYTTGISSNKAMHSKSTQTAPLIGHQVIKHLSLWGHSHLIHHGWLLLRELGESLEWLYPGCMSDMGTVMTWVLMPQTHRSDKAFL